MKTDIKTDIWRKFEKCQDYADKKQLVSKTEKNWNFYIGNQWKGMNTNGETRNIVNAAKSPQARTGTSDCIVFNPFAKVLLIRLTIGSITIIPNREVIRIELTAKKYGCRLSFINLFRKLTI